MLVPQIVVVAPPVGLVTMKLSTQAPVAAVTEVTKLAKSNLDSKIERRKILLKYFMQVCRFFDPSGTLD